MRLRQRTRVVWSSSSGRVTRHGVREARPSARGGRIRWWLRTGALLAVIGLIRLARTAMKYPRPAVSLAGTAITVAGFSLPNGVVLISGFLVLFLALFMPDPAGAPARPDPGRLWATQLTPFTLSSRRLPPPE
jgi:hypothetical protein